MSRTTNAFKELSLSLSVPLSIGPRVNVPCCCVSQPYSRPWWPSEPRGYGLKIWSSVLNREGQYHLPASLPLGRDLGVGILEIPAPFLVKVLLLSAAFRYVELLVFRDPASSFLEPELPTLFSRTTPSGAVKTPSKMDVMVSTVKRETRGNQYIVRLEI